MPLSLFSMHAFTGCDTVSLLEEEKQEDRLNTWKGFPEATHTFEEILLMQRDISDHTMSVLEQFVVLLYDWTSSIMEVNAARKELFTEKSRNLESLQPTQAVLKQQVKRAYYQFN